MQLSAPATATPMQVVATVDSRTRSGASADATTLVADGPVLGDGAADLDAAIAVATEATRGAAVGAAAIFETADGFVARAVRELPHGTPFEVERSRATRPHVTGRMDVHDTSLRAIVDGKRVERMPDYSAATPAAWQDTQLLELTFAGGHQAWSFSTQRRDGARTFDSHFTNVGSNWEDAVTRATRSIRRDFIKDALLLLKGDDGDFYMSGFEGSQNLLDLNGRGSDVPASERLKAVSAVNPAVQAIVGANDIVDLRGRTGELVSPG